MTCRERLAIEHPECVNSKFPGGCKGCPISYKYAGVPVWCQDNDPEACSRCWDQESQDSKIDIQALIDDAMQKRDRSVAVYIHPENGISVHVYPWPDFEDLWKLYKDGKITTNEFRLKMNLPVMKNARNSVKRNPKIFGGERKIDQEE